MEEKIYQILKKHRLPLKKREQLIVDLLDLFSVVNWVAITDSMPDNCDQVFVRYENGKYGINEWWESDNCWKYAFDNMIVKEWCKPPYL